VVEIDWRPRLMQRFFLYTGKNENGRQEMAMATLRERINFQTADGGV
jgi:hypothetical protein